MFCVDAVIARYTAFQRSGAPVNLDVGEASTDMEYSDQVRRGSCRHVLFAFKLFPFVCNTFQSHIFAVANIIRRPIIVFAQRYLGESGANIPINFAGIYLPFFTSPSDADRTPIFIAYLGGDAEGGSLHFVPLVCQNWDNAVPLRIKLQVINPFHSI
jgi:hypothetical protein